MSLLDKLKGGSVDGPRETESEQEKLKKKLEADAKRQEFFNRVKLGKHNVVERSMITIGTMSGFILLGGGISLNAWMHANDETLSSTAVYTNDFVFSKDDSLEGQSQAVYRSKDNKTAYLVFKFSDTENVSFNAKNYQVFLSAKDQHLKVEPTGDFLVLGRSGYMAVRVHSPERLPNQIWDVTIRANKSLTDAAKSGINDSDDYDKTFKEFNQTRFYVNFGASGAIPVSNDISSSAGDMMYQFVGKSEDKSLVGELAKTTKEMKVLFARIDELNQRINDAGYKSPQLPEVLRGLSFNDKGELESKYTLPGGYNIAPGTRLPDGYLNQFVTTDVSEKSIANLKAAKLLEEDKNAASDVKADLSQVRGLTNVPYDYKNNDASTQFVIHSIESVQDGSTLNFDTLNSDTATENQLQAAADVRDLQTLYEQVYGKLLTVQTDINKNRILLDEKTFQQGAVVDQASGKNHFIVWQQRR